MAGLGTSLDATVSSTWSTAAFDASLDVIESSR